MAEIPSNLRYTKDHEWVKVEDGIAIVGLSDFAQEQMGDVVFVELPVAGEEITQGDTFGVVESVKSVNDVYAPISGTIEEINEALQETPELINDDSYGEGWIIKVKPSNENEVGQLMDGHDYENYVKEESE
ncbi:glycine cleavage system protein GcvH [bacterium]|nr:glycine cleavage system protein GcvH [bacterium]